MNKNSIAAMRVAHFGKILTGFAILGAVACLASVVYFLFMAVYYLILIVVLFGTLFLILVEYPEFMNLFSNTEAINNAVANFTVTYVPIIAPVTMAVSAVAIVLLAVSRQKSAIVRLVFSSICFVVSAVITLFAVGGGAQ